MAEAAACVLWVPVDVVKERLQVQQQLKEMMEAPAGARQAASVAAALPSVAAAAESAHGGSSMPPPRLYRGNVDAILSIWRHEGLRGVYRGYGATLASFGPFSAIYFSGYEQCKDLLLHWTMQQQQQQHPRASPSGAGTASSAAAAAAAPPELGFLGLALCGGVAGSVATVLTNPLDLVKLRMQVQRGRSGLQFGYRNVWHGLATLVAQEGVGALFKGAATRCLFHIPSTAITIALVDTLRGRITQARSQISTGTGL